MEAISLILLLLGVATAGIRLSWAGRPWPAALAAIAWAGLPWLSGDLAALRRSFTVRASGTPAAWVLKLQPVEPRAARFLREVRLAGSGTNVRETLLLQANGDVHHMLTRPLP